MITLKNIQDINKDIASKLGINTILELNNVKNDGLYCLIEYLRPDLDLTRDDCFYAICNLNIVGKGRSDQIIVDLMNVDWKLTTITNRFQNEQFDNIESYIQVDTKLRYRIMANEEDPERDIEKNNLDYKKTYELKIFIGA